MIKLPMVLVLTFVVVTCTPRTNQRSAQNEAPSGDSLNVSAQTNFIGVVKETGSGPFKSLVIELRDSDRGGSVAITGDFGTEISRLIGLEVSARGHVIRNPGAPPPVDALNVTSYEILSVNGDKPYVGTLTMRGSDMWIEGVPGDMKLTGYPASLHQKHGAKVWIVGREESGALVVQTYGIIREKS